MFDIKYVNVSEWEQALKILLWLGAGTVLRTQRLLTLRLCFRHGASETGYVGVIRPLN